MVMAFWTTENLNALTPLLNINVKKTQCKSAYCITYPTKFWKGATRKWNRSEKMQLCRPKPHDLILRRVFFFLSRSSLFSILYKTRLDDFWQVSFGSVKNLALCSSRNSSSARVKKNSEKIIAHKCQSNSVNYDFYTS